jgi:hypothetical protein
VVDDGWRVSGRVSGAERLDVPDRHPADAARRRVDSRGMSPERGRVWQRQGRASRVEGG